MRQELRLGEDRGHFDHGWLNTYHSFSFGDYYDPDHMGFSTLRVINEDRVEAGQGFPTHPHRDMEIISYVLAGELAHKDSMGNGSIIVPGDVQRMSAGRGVRHSEYNHAASQTTHFLQIWITPSERGIPPSYEQKRFGEEEKRGRLRLIASPDGHDGSVTLHTDAKVYAGLLNGDESATLALPAERRAYVHVVRGVVTLNGQAVLTGGDAAKLSPQTDGEQVADDWPVEQAVVQLSKATDAEVLVFDLP